MQIEVRIDSGCKEPKVVIHTDRMTDEIQELVRRLSDSAPQVRHHCLKQSHFTIMSHLSYQIFCHL